LRSAGELATRRDRAGRAPLAKDTEGHARISSVIGGEISATKPNATANTARQ